MQRRLRGTLYQHLRVPFAQVLGTVLFANVLFVILIVVSPADPDVVINRVQTAFQTGELGLVDYLPFDWRRGWHQYNDCNVLQMLSNKDSSRLERALAPVIYSADKESNGQCAMLYSLVVEGMDRETLIVSRYARYWHGYNVPTALALHVMELKDFRRVLSGIVWLAIGTLAVATYRSRPHVRRTGTTIALVATFAWAAPYYSPGITHGPGDALLLLALAGIAAWPHVFVRLNVILPYAAGFGSTVVFFEMLTGQLPIAAAWLMALTLAAGRDEERPEGLDAPVVALAAFLAFGFGAAMTVVAKQVLALLLVDPNAGGQFLTQLRYYMAVIDFEPGWPGILEPFGRLVRKSNTLTYGNTYAGYALIVTMAITWLAAVVRGWRWRHSAHGRDILILLSATLIVVAWVLLLPRHMYIHAVFMVRILVVPISLAPLAVCWPRTRESSIRSRVAVVS